MVSRPTASLTTVDRSRISALIGALLLAVVLVLGVPTSTASAATRQVDAEVPAPSTSAAIGGGSPVMPADGPMADPAAAPLDPGAAPVDPSAASAVDGPQPLGRALPPRRQRLMDTAILVGLLVVLFGGGAWWVWSSLRRPAGR